MEDLGGIPTKADYAAALRSQRVTKCQKWKWSTLQTPKSSARPLQSASPLKVTMKGMKRWTSASN